MGFPNSRDYSRSSKKNVYDSPAKFVINGDNICSTLLPLNTNLLHGDSTVLKMHMHCWRIEVWFALGKKTHRKSGSETP